MQCLSGSELKEAVLLLHCTELESPLVEVLKLILVRILDTGTCNVVGEMLVFLY